MMIVFEHVVLEHTVSLCKILMNYNKAEYWQQYVEHYYVRPSDIYVFENTLIASEIGDINRFPDSSHLVSYAGLAPFTRSSAGRLTMGLSQCREASI